MDAVDDDKAFAVGEAKSLRKRARGLAAVRVVAVEPRNGEFHESVVFYGSSGLAPSVASPRAEPGVVPALPTGVALAAVSARPTARVLLLLLLLLTATIGALNSRNAVAHPWAFDSPEAQRLHTISMPWAR